MKDKPKYNMLQSMGFMVKSALKKYRAVPFLTLGTALTASGIYVLELFLAPRVLARLQEKSTLAELLITLGFFAGGLYVLNWLAGYFQKQGYFLHAAVRCELADDVRYKSMTTSYPNTIDPNTVNLRNLANSATLASSRGCERIWETSAGLLTSLICFCIYLALLTNLSLVMILLVIATSVLCFYVSNKIYDWGHRHRDEDAKNWTEQLYMHSVIFSSAMAKDIHIFNLSSWLRGILQGSLGKSRDFIHRRESHYMKAHLLDLATALVRNAAAYAYLLALAIRDGMSAPEFLLYFSAVTGFAGFVTGILERVSDLRQCCRDVSNVMEYLKLPEPFKLDSGEAIPQSETYELTLENVSFTYPGTDKPVVKNLSLTLRAGESLALVGLNGAGKTTLVRLLCGFYDPDSGRVLLNGRDIRDFNRREYYKLFSAVFQDYSALDVTVGENVSQQVHGADTDKIWDALKKAGLDGAVKGYPQGLDTYVGRDVFLDGVLFSGGQTQRLMLARALYKNGPILVLDEPTAALDPIAENDIYMKYRAMTEGKTGLFISHRLASTRFCDRIIFLGDGKILEEGTHNELIALNGEYARLFEIQSRYYREDVEA